MSARSNQDLRRLIAASGVLVDLHADSFESAITQAVDHAVSAGQIPASARVAAIDALLECDAADAAIEHGVGIPHAHLDGIERQVVVHVRLSKPLLELGPDGVALHSLFVLLGPCGADSEHLELLMDIAQLEADDTFRYEAREARDAPALLAAIDAHFERLSPPASDEAPPVIDDSLATAGPLFSGIARDIRRRRPLYARDFADGLHPKAIGSTLFLYFACLAPAITFGGFMSSVTGGSIGAVEMLLATAIGGVVYALFSAQPLTILGGTGPLLVLTEVLYILCQQLGIPFLATYAWVGLWTAALTLVLAATGASALIRFFTRFTDEIFAALISLIFIVEAVQKLLSPSASAESTLLSLLLGLGTFYVATALSRFRKSRFLLTRVRGHLADFGATIAVASMTAIAYFYFGDVTIQSLDVPDQLQTTSGRAWAVDLWAVPTWVIFATLGPAIVTTVLVYLDQNITARLVNNPDNKLTRGAGYHLDLTVVGLLIGVFSLFGLPWLVAATVRSLNHVRSLATTEEVVSARGDKSDRIIHVRENRVTGLAIHLLIGASLLLLPTLRIIPMPVLYGLFLFMGVVSMAGNQLFERLSLWGMDIKRYPKKHYTHRVPTRVIHAFTAIQAVCLATLWLVKTSALAILFPLFIAVLVPIRMALGRWFEPAHLAALDAEEEPADDIMTEPGA